MNLHYECMACRMKSEMALMEQLMDNDLKVAFMKDVCQALCQADPNYASPALNSVMDQINSRYGFARPDYEPLKKRYNDMMLSLLPELEEQVRSADDPLAQAIKLSRAGNYIDFGAFKSIDDQILSALIERAGEEVLDEAEYAHLLLDLQDARRLTYITDNCGEVALDNLVLAQLAQRFPALNMTVMTRGGATLNDATVEDALYVGLDRYAQVVDSGVALAGCQLELISPQARDILTQSDVIIAKGMGNFETMSQCGLNAYYLFLCKCDYFARRLAVPLMTGMMVNDRRMFLHE